MGSLKLTTASSGSVILSPANTASDVTITVPAVTGTMDIQGPAFSAYSATNQSISAGVPTKVVCGTEEFDTNNNKSHQNLIDKYYNLIGNIQPHLE